MVTCSCCYRLEKTKKKHTMIMSALEPTTWGVVNVLSSSATQRDTYVIQPRKPSSSPGKWNEATRTTRRGHRRCKERKAAIVLLVLLSSFVNNSYHAAGDLWNLRLRRRLPPKWKSSHQRMKNPHRGLVDVLRLVSVVSTSWVLVAVDGNLRRLVVVARFARNC